MIVTETPTSTVHLNTFQVSLVNSIYFEHNNFFLSLNGGENVLRCHNVNLKLMFIPNVFFFFSRYVCCLCLNVQSYSRILL